MLCALLLFLATSLYAVDAYVWCGTNTIATSSARPLPVQGVSLTTGKVVVGLPQRSRVEVADCGWYKIKSADKPVAYSNEVYRLAGYRREGLDAVPFYSRSFKPVVPVEYSRRLLYREFVTLGAWDKVRDWMQSQGVWEDFLFATTLESDDALMVGAIKAIPGVIGITEAQLKEILSRCVAD